MDRGQVDIIRLVSRYIFSEAGLDKKKKNSERNID